MNTIRWFLPSLCTSNSVSISDNFSGRRRTNFQRLRGMSLSFGAQRYVSVLWSNAAAEVVYEIPEITGDLILLPKTTRK